MDLAGAEIIQDAAVPDNSIEIVETTLTASNKPIVKSKITKRARTIQGIKPMQPTSTDISVFTTTINSQDHFRKDEQIIESVEIVPPVKQLTAITVAPEVLKKKRVRKDSSKKLAGIESSNILEEASVNQCTDVMNTTAAAKKNSSTTKKITASITQSALLIQTPANQIAPEIALKIKLNSDKLNLLTQELRQFEMYVKIFIYNYRYICNT